MKRVFFLLATIVLTLGCHGGNNPAPATGATEQDNLTTDPHRPRHGHHHVSISTTVQKAKEILGQYPTGKYIVAELEGENTLGKPIRVKLVPDTKIRENEGHLGRFKREDDGQYSILVSDNLDPRTLSHVLAHEVVHIEQDKEEDAYIRSNPIFGSRMHAVLIAAKAKNLASADARDVDIFFKSLMFAEVKAYQVNLRLEEEGLPFPNEQLKQMGLGAYVVKAYLEQNGYILREDLRSLMHRIDKYQSLVDFQKSL